jgi:hypothetical protein
VTTIEFTIRRDPDIEDPEGIEYWVYEEVLGARQQGEYIIITMQDRSAFIPGNWIVSMKEI